MRNCLSALSKSNVDIDSLVSNMPGFVLIKDLNSDYITANSNLVNEFGLKNADNLLGYSDFTIPHPLSDNASLYRDLDIEAIKTNGPIQGVITLPFQGSIKPYFYKKFILNDEAGNSRATISHAEFCNDSNLEQITLALIKDDPLNTRHQARSYIMNKQYQGIQLTPIESCSLFYLLRQKSKSEMARLLNLSADEINRCLEGIKTQLNADSLSDIIEISIARQYINIVPPGIFSQLFANPRHPIRVPNSVKITSREKECAQKIMNGSTVKETAAILHLSPRTVETHINNLKVKLNCRNKTELIFKLRDYLNCE